MIIVIDGPSGTGKSTTAKGLAKKLGFTFFDTGAMYRAVAWFLTQEGIDLSDRADIGRVLPQFQYDIQVDDQGERHYFVGKCEVTEAIRNPAISSKASKISAYPEVRQALVHIQRGYGHRSDAVFEGRDMGTVVFPDADLKIFLTAKSETRARRRYEELLLKFPELAESLSLEQVLKELEERDQNDSTRAIAPLRQAPDAILIDTSDLSSKEVIEKILAFAARRKQYPPMKWSYKIVYWTARIYFKLFFRLRIHGLDHFRPGAGILASNHTSNFDPPVLSISCPEEVHFLAKESLFEIPLLGRLIRTLNSHPVSRSSSDARTFRELIQLLRDGKKVILFPEGTRSFDGTLQPLERGLAFIAQKSRCPVFPVYIAGAFLAWPPQKKLPKLFGRIEVVFGSPIEWDDEGGLEKREAEKRLTERTAQAIQSLKYWLEGGRKGKAP